MIGVRKANPFLLDVPSPYYLPKGEFKMSEEIKDVSGDISQIAISKVIIGERQRSDYGDIVSLQISIERRGLQYPIIVQPEGENYLLLAGGRRLQAFKNLQRTFIPAIFKENLNEFDRKELELEENLVRKNLNYIEEAKAVAELDRIKREKYGSSLPGRFSPRGGWTQKDTAKALNLSEGKVSQDIQIYSAILKHPELELLPTRRDILREIRKIEEGVLPQISPAQLTTRISECFVSKDVSTSIKEIPSESIDLLFVDLIPELDEELFAAMIRRMKINAQGFIFFSLEKLPILQERMRVNKLNHSDRPFIWHIKSKDDYLPFFWFSRGLSAPPKALSWHMSYTNDKDSIHSLAKPRELYHELISKSSCKGGVVINLTAHDMTCVKVSIELNRIIRAYCPSQLLFDQYIISTKEI